MAGNIQQRGLLKVVAPETLGTPAKSDIAIGQTSLPDTGIASSGAAAEQSWQSIAKDLSGLGSVIGSYADHAAKVEGQREGHLAGLDPEFRPTGAMTIRGEAFDRAGLATYESTVKIEIEKDIDAGGDLKAKQAAWTSKVPRELVPEVTHLFRRADLAKSREATRAAAAEAAASAKAALLDEIDRSVRGLHQRASALGLDAKADETLAQDIALMSRTLQRAGPDGKPMVSPVEAQRIMSNLRETVADARLTGMFERLPSVEAKKALLDKIDADFKGSTGIASVYDFQSYQRIRHQLEAGLNRAASERRVMASAVVDEIKDATKLVEKGYPLTAEQLTGLRARGIASGDPVVAANIDALEELGSFQAQARVTAPAALDAYADGLREQIRKRGPNQAIVARLEMTTKLADEARRELKADPLGWADRTGTLKVQPLDLSAPNAAASVRMRIAQAEEIGRYYAQAPVYLRPEEKRRLAVEASKGGDAMLAVTDAITRAAGDRAPKVLAEIFDHAPVVAMTGWHVGTIGKSGITDDVAAGVALSRTDGFKPVAPSADRARSAAVSAHGGALSRLPDTEQAAIAMTNAAYEMRARRRGLTEYDQDLWQTTFREVMGERRIQGESYGGITRSGSESVVVPPNVKTRRLGDLVRAIELNDLADAPPGYGDGRQATLADIRRSSLVSIGDGKYWMNLGTPEAPRYLTGAEGAPYVLDINALEPVLKPRVPDAYLGGGERKPSRPPGMMRLGGPIDGAGDRSQRTLDDPTATAVIGGERSMTADRDRLAVAEILDRRGADNTLTWIETGWWRGRDGKWRHEIPDADAKIKLPSLDGAAEATSKLGDVLDHPQLFKAYPSFANVKVRLVDTDTLTTRPGLPAGTYGYVDRAPDGKPQITLAARLDPAELRAALLHEVQHVLQGTERFNYGAALPYAQRPGEIEARAVEDRAMMTPEQLAAQPPFAPQMRLGGPDAEQGAGRFASPMPLEPQPLTSHQAMAQEVTRIMQPLLATLNQAAGVADLVSGGALSSAAGLVNAAIPGQPLGDMSSAKAASEQALRDAVKSVGRDLVQIASMATGRQVKRSVGLRSNLGGPQDGQGADGQQADGAGAAGIPPELSAGVKALAERLELDDAGRQRLDDLMFSDHILAGIDAIEMTTPGPERDRMVQIIVNDLERVMKRRGKAK